MKFVCNFLIVLLIQSIGALNLFSQANDVAAFEVPFEQVSLLFVSDPTCPLQLSGPTRIIGYSHGGLSFGYSLTNKSNANIESFLVEEVNWFGSKGYSHPSAVNKGQIFGPGMTDHTLPFEEKIKILPFDDSLAKKSGITNITNKIWIVMIVKVKLSDGSNYDASQKFSLLSDFVEKPYSKVGMSPADLRTREQQLREFVSKLPVSN
jgi:hypothetical protein